MKELKIKLSEGAYLPERKTEQSAGLDLYSPIDFTIPPSHSVRGGTAVAVGTYQVNTGVAIQLDKGWEATSRSRSGMAFVDGIVAFFGTIDADYRGEIKVLFYNMTPRSYEVKRGDRIAQLVISPVGMPALKVVDALDETERGKGGFGHTGK